MARTILGLDMVDTFTSSETCPERGERRLTHNRDTRAGQRDSTGRVRLSRGTGEKDVTAAGLTMVKGMNWRMLPRLPCSRQSTHSSMNHWTNWVWVPAVLAPRMEEMSRKRFAVETGKYQKPGKFREAEVAQASCTGDGSPPVSRHGWIRPHGQTSPPGTPLGSVPAIT